MHRPLAASLIALLLGCASSGSAPSGSSVAAVGAAAPATRSSTSAPVATRASVDARIAELRRAFDCDVAAEIDVCTAKDGMVGTLTRKRLEPVVLSTGTISLRSVYRDRDWIHHDHVVVRIGNRELRSEAQRAESPAVSRRIARQPGRDSRGRATVGYIAETVTYRGASDGGITEAIAKAGAAEVHVRFTGGPRQFEMTMSDDDKRLFARGWELAALYRERGR